MQPARLDQHGMHTVMCCAICFKKNDRTEKYMNWVKCCSCDLWVHVSAIYGHCGRQHTTLQMSNMLLCCSDTYMYIFYTYNLYHYVCDWKDIPFSIGQTPQPVYALCAARSYSKRLRIRSGARELRIQHIRCRCNGVNERFPIFGLDNLMASV